MRLWPTLLSRTIIRGNILLLVPTLLLGIGLYLLTDLFEKLDNFLEAQVPLAVMATYFVVKIPLVVSQILPVIFLLSVVIQLCLMARNRELTALQAGGISLAVPARVLILCGVLCAGAQLGFSEVLGVAGERESSRIWAEEVRKRDLSSAVFKDVWFTDRHWIVSLGTLRPGNKGEGFVGYELVPREQKLLRIVQAKTYAGEPGNWQLYSVTEYMPAQYSTRELPSLTLPLEQDPGTFRLFTRDTTPSQLPIWQLSSVIERLSSSGSNVEKLRTVWHTKVAYAASLVVMALIAVALVSWNSNIYLATCLSLMCTFLYYAAFTISTSLGQRGVIPPPLAAWGANIVAAALAGIRLVPLFFQRRF